MTDTNLCLRCKHASAGHRCHKNLPHGTRTEPVVDCTHFADPRDTALIDAARAVLANRQPGTRGMVLVSTSVLDGLQRAVDDL